jgi:hypothetical protein
MRKYLLSAALIVGILFDVLFWGKIPGISFPVFVFFCLATGFFLIKAGGLNPARNNFLLLIPIFFLSIMTFIHKEPFTSFLNITLTLFVMAVLAMSYLSGQWYLFGVIDYVVNFFYWIIGILSIQWLASDNKDPQQKDNGISTWMKNAKPFIRGVLLALPLLIIFSAFFASADMVFARQVNLLFASLRLENLPEYILRGFLILGIAYLFMGITLYAAKRSNTARLSGTEKPVIMPFLGFIETSIILIGVLLLFSVFVLIQFKYLFLGQANITLQGFTYSEYARKGFGELVAVAVFSMLLIKSLSTMSKCDTQNKTRAFTGLTISLVTLVLIILVSAYQRLYLYESAYGFSRSRTYAHVFILWLGVLMLAVVIMEIIHQQRSFANITLAVVLGFTVSLNMLNVDSFIVRNNINRTVQGELLDISYLSSLSTDAIPELASDFSSGKFSPKIHEGLGAALACSQQRTNNVPMNQMNWQSFHLSNWVAERELQKIQEELKTFQALEKDGQTFVKSPNGTEYQCQGYSVLD